MNGLGGLNKSPGGVVVGLVQLQNPVVATRVELTAQCRRICELTGKARRGMPSMDLVVFPSTRCTESEDPTAQDAAKGHVPITFGAARLSRALRRAR